MEYCKQVVCPELSPADFQPLGEGTRFDEQMRPSTRYWPEVWRRLRRSPVAVLCMALLGVIVLAAILVPIFSPYEYDVAVLADARQGPSAAHWFGTDQTGRDLFTRVWMGTRVSLLIGLVGALLPYLIGIVIGAIAGWFGGKVDMILMRIVDIMICIPSMIYMILILVVLGGGAKSLIVALAIAGWMGSARSFRGRVLQFKNREFVLAARVLGARPGRIVFRHILPNILGNMAVGLCSAIPAAIFAEASMSFIGLGITPPQTSLGQLCTDGTKVLLTQLHCFVCPAIIISLIIFCLYLFGNCLRDALDPRLKDEEYLARKYRRRKRA